jgi:hypothetical protein
MQQEQIIRYENTRLARSEEMSDKVEASLVSDEEKEPTAPSPRTKVRAPRKKVTFTPNNPVPVSNTNELTDTERVKVWYTGQDLQGIRKRARTLALRIHQNRDKNDFDYSYACTMEAVFKQARNLSEEEELKLWAWFSQGPARRGLERLSAHQLGRNQQAKAAVRKVLQKQKELSKIEADRITKANLLARASQIESDQARALAEVFGKADMVAAQLEEQQSS